MDRLAFVRPHPRVDRHQLRPQVHHDVADERRRRARSGSSAGVHRRRMTDRRQPRHGVVRSATGVLRRVEERPLDRPRTTEPGSPSSVSAHHRRAAEERRVRVALVHTHVGDLGPQRPSLPRRTTRVVEVSRTRTTCSGRPRRKTSTASRGGPGAAVLPDPSGTGPAPRSIAQAPPPPARTSAPTPLARTSTPSPPARTSAPSPAPTASSARSSSTPANARARSAVSHRVSRTVSGGVRSDGVGVRLERGSRRSSGMRQDRRGSASAPASGVAGCVGCPWRQCRPPRLARRRRESMPVEKRAGVPVVEDL